jgi:hypothetical protein
MPDPKMAPIVAPAEMTPKKPSALLGTEKIDVELPEHRDHEEIVDRDPDEEGAPDP